MRFQRAVDAEGRYYQKGRSFLDYGEVAATAMDELVNDVFAIVSDMDMRHPHAITHINYM